MTFVKLGLSMAATVLALGACNSSVTGDCPGGQLRNADNICKPVCSITGTCPAEHVCVRGLCEVAAAGMLPKITDVFGNHAEDGSSIENGLVIVGSGLSEVSNVYLKKEAQVLPDLSIYEQQADRLKVLLPVSIVSGEYILVAKNAFDTVDVSIVLELPELGPDVLLSRVNSASGKVSLARLPVGIGAENVAAGDHHHNDVYLTIPEGQTLANDVETLNSNLTDLENSITHGDALLPNPNFDRGVDGLYAWSVATDGSYTMASIAAEGHSGPVALANDPLSRVALTGQRRIVVDHGSTYELRGALRNVGADGADGTFSLGVRFWTGAGEELLDGEGWWVYAAEKTNRPPEDGWRAHRLRFGWGTQRPIPAGATTMAPAALLNDHNGGPGTQLHQVQGIAMRDVSGDVYAPPAARFAINERVEAVAVSAATYQGRINRTIDGVTYVGRTATTAICQELMGPGARLCRVSDLERMITAGMVNQIGHKDVPGGISLAQNASYWISGGGAIDRDSYVPAYENELRFATNNSDCENFRSSSGGLGTQWRTGSVWTGGYGYATALSCSGRARLLCCQ